VLTDALSLDAIKKTPGYTTLPQVTTPTVLFSLPPHFPDAHPPSLTLPSYQYFKKTFGTSPERLLAAKRNFAASLAAYSLFSYILQVPTAVDVTSLLFLTPLHHASHATVGTVAGRLLALLLHTAGANGCCCYVPVPVPVPL